MNYLVFCTFDLKNASSKDYQNAYAALNRLGLVKVHKGDKGNTVIPTTSAMGTFPGASATSIVSSLYSSITMAFNALGLKSEIFVVAGGNDNYWMGAVT